MKLSIIVPVYNERNTICQILDRLQRSGCSEFEWIVVDDGSTDGTTELLQGRVPTLTHCILKPINQGKSAAVRSGLEIATGDWVIVQDADLEYDPSEIPKLLAVAETALPRTVAVYGRRPSCWDKPSRWLFASGVLGVDCLLLLFYRRWVRDHASCYKLVPRSILQSFDLNATGFEGCIEITAKLMRSQIPILQVPITYSPRKTTEGKKLTVGYGPAALRAVWGYRHWRAG